MQRNLGRYLALLSAVRKLRTRDSELVLVSIPKKTFDALQEQRLSPEDDPAQLIRDALATHYQVMGYMRQGATVGAKKDGQFSPLDLSHILMPEVRSALSAIVTRAKRI